MTLDFGLKQIQESVRQRKVLFSNHVNNEMLDEDISPKEIREAILSGTIIEDYPKHRRGSCCLIYGRTKEGRNLHVVVTKGKAPLIVITAYEPMLPYWTSPTKRGR